MAHVLLDSSAVWREARLLAVFVLLSLCAWCAGGDPGPPNGSGPLSSLGLLRVALHAQSRYSDHGWVAGSEITTSGMIAALRRHPSVGRAEVFAPFAYKGLFSASSADDDHVRDRGLVRGVSLGAWDLLIVEGWTGPVPRVIASLRAANPAIVVLHWCLDTYPSLAAITRLDVDGFLTNSAALVGVLGAHAPVLLLPLAADLSVMAPVPRREEYAHPIVYLGQASTTKHRLLEVLTEVAPLGLAIYGLGWDRHNGQGDDPRFERLRPYWKGVLPKDDIAALYSSAQVVIGTTEADQRSLGMVNNRVFEALACGAVFVSDQFPALEALVGRAVAAFHTAEPGSARKAVEGLLGSGNEEAAAAAARRAAVGAAGRKHVAGGHTYDHRVAALLPWVAASFGLGPPAAASSASAQLGQRPSAPDPSPGSGRSSSAWLNGFEAAPRVRPNLPKLLVLVDDNDYDNDNDDNVTAGRVTSAVDLPFSLGLLPALALLDTAQRFEVTVRSISPFFSSTGAVDHGIDPADLEVYALVVGRCAWASPLRRTLAAAAATPTFPPTAVAAADSASRAPKAGAPRAAIGLLLRQGSGAHATHAARASLPTDGELRAFDVVVHDDWPALRCSVGTGGTAGRGSADTVAVGPCGEQRNAVRGLSVDMFGLREGSEGWGDPRDGHKWGHAAIVPSLAALQASGHAAGVDDMLGERWGARLAAALCANDMLGSPRALFVLSPPPSTSLSSSPPPPPRARGATALARLESCGVEVHFVSRPETLPGLLRSTARLLIAPGTPGDAATLLAGLAAGANVELVPTPGGGAESLASLLQAEVEKVSVRGRPPLEDFDVSPSPPPAASPSRNQRPHRALLSPAALSLAAAFDAAVFGPRAAAAVAIVDPPAFGASISARACADAMASSGQPARLRVAVAVEAFRLPDDGTWCLRVNGAEVACVGDHQFAVEASVPPEACAQAGGTLELQAVLRGGDLESPRVVFESPVVVVAVI